ncbi:MAG TPA: site-specific DNA-methyltransferase [Jiangellaceae bacterium]
MTPYYADASVTLYRGEALAVLRELPDASVDAVITDPPYSSGGQFRGDRAKRTGEKYVNENMATLRSLNDFTGDNRDQRGFEYWCALWLGECLRVTRPGGLLMLFTDWRQLPALTDSVQAGGWVWRGIIPWNKPNARVFAGRITNACEYVVWGSHGQLPNPLDGGAGFPGFYVVSSPREREHQAQKPLDVMRGLMAPVPTDGLVLDPFAGSGTTGVAAVIEGRRFVGVELTEHYAQVAVDRLRTAAMQPGTGEQADIFAELARG